MGKKAESKKKEKHLKLTDLLIELDFLWGEELSYGQRSKRELIVYSHT